MSITPEVSAKTLTQLVALEIRVAMTRADIKQSELARTLGKTEQWLSVRLRGKQPIDLNDLALIASGIGVGVHQLLPPPELVALAANPPAPGTKDSTRPIRSDETFKVSCASVPRTGDDDERRPPVNPPIMPVRHDPRRPVSAIPARKRRPQPVRPGVRPMPR